MLFKVVYSVPLQNYLFSGLVRIKLLFFFISLFLYSGINGQTQECLALLLEYKYEDAISCSNDSEGNISYVQLIEVLKNKGLDNPLINQKKNATPVSKLIDSITKGYYLLYKDTKQINKPFNLFNYALTRSQQLNNKMLEKLSLLAIINTYNYSLVQSTKEAELYLSKLEDLIESPVDEYHYLTKKVIYGLRNIQFKVNVAPNTISRLETLMLEFPKGHPFWVHFYSYVGSYYEGVGDLEKSKEYFNNSISITNSNKSLLFRGFIRLAEISRKQKEYDKSIRYIDSAKSYINEKDTLRSLYYLNNYASEYYYLDDSYKKAYETLKASKIQGDELLYRDNALEISNLNVKYQTSEKEKQILEEQAQKKRNQNIAIGLGGSLLLTSIIAFLVYRNTKRKQRIAEQEKELEIQKTTTLLKEQEITTINAMIEGQEKERLRLAGDLHDNLGGTLAAVKMHIGNLQANLGKSDNPQGLLDKANTLISEAYTNVRSIAHERNSGVMAKEGLLPAIEKLASKVSSSNGLSIEVQDFGLEDRLSNHIEITIFRIVQELITNIIKHAQATEATISLTQHDSELNIMVEDNGKGFKVGKLEDKDGMGLGSIERRVEHLEGTMEVDSTLDKGTNIIIDIPL